MNRVKKAEPGAGRDGAGSLMFFVVIVILLAIGIVAAVFWSTRPSNADENRGAWFRSLKQPDNGSSCCDVADCKQTVAEYIDGSWWAKVRGVIREIPPNKILIKPHSIDGEAYVCASESGPAATAFIYCFIPQPMGF